MSTVRCPSCGRALKLPAGEEGVASRCPLCGWEFIAAAAPRPRPADPPPSPSPPTATLPELGPDDVQAMDAASTWLGLVVLLGTVHAFFTYCGTLGVLLYAFHRLNFGTELLTVGLIGLLSAQVLAFARIWYASVALRKRTYSGWVRLVVFLPAVLAVAYGAGSIAILFAPQEHFWRTHEETYRLLLFLTGAAMGLVCWLAFLRTRQALARPLVGRYLASLPKDDASASDGFDS